MKVWASIVTATLVLATNVRGQFVKTSGTRFTLNGQNFTVVG